MSRNTLADELLDSPKEAHAVANGIYVGFTAIPDKSNWSEPHYWKIGFLIGRLLYVCHILLLVLSGGVWL